MKRRGVRVDPMVALRFAASTLTDGQREAMSLIEKHGAVLILSDMDSVPPAGTVYVYFIHADYFRARGWALVSIAPTKSSVTLSAEGQRIAATVRKMRS